jgi:hypothetical protein
VDVRFFKTINCMNAERSISALINRDRSLPGLGLWYGRWGLGKSSVANWIYSTLPVFYIIMERLWRPRRLLEEFCDILSLGSPQYRLDRLSDQVAEGLRKWDQPVIIDEADYLMKNSIMLDVLRDLHDKTGTPFILIGMEKLHSDLQRFGQFFSRILPASIVEFQPVMPMEISLITKEWTGLMIDDDAAELFCQLVEGDFRYIVGYLLSFEKACKDVNKTDVIDLNLVKSVFRNQAKKIKKRIANGTAARKLIETARGREK